VGQFVSSRTITTFRDKTYERVAKQGGNVVTYFCTPGEQVLGWVVGPAAAEEVISAGRQALKARKVLKRWSKWDAAKQREMIREHFLSELQPLNRQGMRAWTSFDPKDEGRFDDDDVARVFSLAKATRSRTQVAINQQISVLVKAGRFSSPEIRAEASRAQNAVRADLSHMVLADLPLISLEMLRQPIFENLARQKFEPRSERNDELLKSVRDSIDQEQPTLLVVAGDLDAPRKDPVLANLLRYFSVEQLTSKELTRLSDDLDHPPVETLRGLVNFVFLNALGERTGVISQVRYGKKGRGYRSLLRDSEEKPQRSVDTPLLEELKRALDPK